MIRGKGAGEREVVTAIETPERPEQRVSGTWLLLGSGFIAVGLVWSSLAYRFQISDAPRAMLTALVIAALHIVAGVLTFRRARVAFLSGLVAVVVGIVVAIGVRVFFLIGVEFVAGVLLILGRTVLLSDRGRG